MKKKFIIIYLCVNAILFLTGFTYTSESPNIVVKSNLADRDIIYFPINYVDYISIEDNNVINMSSYSVRGLTANNIVVYFDTYNAPYYRNNYDSYEYQITEVLENNLYNTTESQFNNKKDILVFSLLGGGLLCLFLILIKR